MSRPVSPPPPSAGPSPEDAEDSSAGSVRVDPPPSPQEEAAPATGGAAEAPRARTDAEEAGSGDTDLTDDASRNDRLFRRLTGVAAASTLVLILAIALFLVLRALDALRLNEANFLTETNFSVTSDPPSFGIAALIFGTVLSSIIALVLAIPVAIGVALFISHYAPRRLAQGLGVVIDLLAAVPSVVYGLWGLQFLNGQVIELSAWLEKWFGWTYVLGTDRGFYGNSIFLAGIILGIMILPITAAVSREVFLQTPNAHEEAALALGATKWEMVRTAVLPYGRPGVIGASMLGLGRALGETIAVALVLSTSYEISLRVLEPGGTTIASNIALKFAEADSTGRGALIASGLALFVLTLLVNYAARVVVARRKEFRGTAA